MRELAIRGMYGEVALLREGASKKSLRIAYGWYYDAAVLAARGDFKGAAEILESAAGEGTGDTGSRGPAASYALGSLYGAMGDPAKASAAFSRAVSAARGAKERGAALKALGRALGDSGDPSRGVGGLQVRSRRGPGGSRGRDPGARRLGEMKRFNRVLKKATEPFPTLP